MRNRALLVTSLALSAACGAGDAGGPGTSPATVAPEPPPPTRWLAGLQQADVLVYEVSRPDGQTTRVRMRVQTLLARGGGIAAHLVPDDSTERQAEAYWLVGDERGLTRLTAPASSSHVPLDAHGQVVSEWQGRPVRADWRIPAEWSERRSTEGAMLEGGWRVDELDLRLEGPIRGDRCARIQRDDEVGTISLVVCANVGLVEATTGTPGGVASTERWRLVEIGRRVAQM